MTRGAERTCLGCRQVRPRGSLLRLVRGEDGQARVDPLGAGRGAYTCPTEKCLREALSRGRLGHAFRRPTTPPPGGVEAILDAIRERING